MKKICLLLLIILFLTGCETVENTNNQISIENNEVVHTGKCLEYATEYKTDCGLFTCSDSFCCERKYDVCVRWEE